MVRSFISVRTKVSFSRPSFAAKNAADVSISLDGVVERAESAIDKLRYAFRPMINGLP